MEFGHINSLWLLFLLPPLAFWAVRGESRRAAGWAALGRDGRPGRGGAAGWLAAVGLLCVALAQPRWGRRAGPDLPPGHDVVLLIDTSRSMGTRDAVPDRLGLAVEVAETLVRAVGRERGSRVAVVSFAGQAKERCPLTGNLGAVADALRSLRPGEVQPGGTDLGTALFAAADAFDEAERAEGRTIVLFSDGEDHVGAWEAATADLKGKGIIVHAVAVGDAERGGEVPAARGSGLLLYEGKPVISRRLDAAPAAVARATGGAFVPLGLAPADLGRLYVERIAPIARREREARQPPERVERYTWFVLAALVSGLGGSWLGRRRPTAAWALAGLGLTTAAGAGPLLDDALVEGRAAYAAGRLQDALAAFERAARLDPRSGEAAFDAAAALFKLERFAEANARYRQARELADPVLRIKVDYALGNTALALGDVAAAVRHYEGCLASTARGADSEAVRRDAAINLRYAQSLPRPPEPPPEEGPSPRPKGRPSTKSNEGTAPREDEEPSTGDAQSSQGDRTAGPRREAPPGSLPSGRSADEQLDAALNRIRAEAERRRIPEAPVAPPEGGRKDW